MAYNAKTAEELRTESGTPYEKIADELALIETEIDADQALASTYIIVGSSGGVATDVDMTGDITISNTGATTIGADKVLPSMKNIGDYVEFVDEFAGAAPDAVQWSLNDTSSAGTPTQTYEADETAVTMTLDSNDEAEVCGYDFGDKLQFDIDDNPIFIARFKVPTIATNQEAVIGMCAAWADTLDNNVAHAWFRLKANMDLLLETDDNGSVDESEDSTVNLTADTYLWIMIDFADTSDVLFYTGTDGKTWAARAPKTFDMSNYTAGLQPAFAILKSTGVTTPTISVDIIKVYADRP